MTLLPLSDPTVAATPTQESRDPMVALHAEGRLFLDLSSENQQSLGYDHVFVLRRGVLEKLRSAAAALPTGYGLLLKETWRPAPFQAFIFERRKNRLASQHTELSESELVTLTSRFIAPPWVAGHPTGGAFDVALCDEAGRELEMGCAYDEDEVTSEGRCYSVASGLTEDALKHRRLMFGVLTAQGFVNYPFEWWHWSYGDKYWAVMANQPHALYDAVAEV